MMLLQLVSARSSGRQTRSVQHQRHPRVTLPPPKARLVPNLATLLFSHPQVWQPAWTGACRPAAQPPPRSAARRPSCPPGLQPCRRCPWRRGHTRRQQPHWATLSRPQLLRRPALLAASHPAMPAALSHQMQTTCWLACTARWAGCSPAAPHLPRACWLGMQPSGPTCPLAPPQPARRQLLLMQTALTMCCGCSRGCRSDRKHS